MGQCLLKVTQQINDKIKLVSVSQLSSYCFATSPTMSSFDICSSITVLLPGKPDAWDFFGSLRLCEMRSRMFLKSYTWQEFDTGSHHFFVVSMGKTRFL